MSWARLDDNFHDHPKIAGLENRNDALNVWVRLLTWCHKQRTGGRVPSVIANKFGTAKALDRLVAQGLFERTGDGFQFHDFADYAPARLALRREAGRIGGLQSGVARRRAADQREGANVKQTLKQPEANVEALASLLPKPVPSRPVPTQIRDIISPVSPAPAGRSVGGGR